MPLKQHVTKDLLHKCQYLFGYLFFFQVHGEHAVYHITSQKYDSQFVTQDTIISLREKEPLQKDPCIHPFKNSHLAHT